MTKANLPLSGEPPPALMRALRRLLRPLVRLLLEYQITFPAFANLLKSVYVEEATRSFAIPGRPQTVSRLTLLTGIHRKDVKRLQDEPPEDDRVPATVSLGAQLVLRWTTDPQYQTSDGKPIALPRLARDRTDPSFESLVESVSKDIRPRAILDEWQRLGVAIIDSEDHVQLVANAFVPKLGFDEKAYYLGRNLHDHLAATAHNLIGEGKPLLERSVYYGNLRAESVEILERLATEVGMNALQRINREARTLQKADASRPEHIHRMRFGVYFYHQPQNPEAQTDPAAVAAVAETGSDGARSITEADQSKSVGQREDGPIEGQGGSDAA